jgi:hypothetical protein
MIRTVTILDIENGQRHETKGEWSDYWWQYGNGCCDCNRSIFCGLSKPGFNQCLGSKRFLIVGVEGHVGSLMEFNLDYDRAILIKHGIL